MSSYFTDETPVAPPTATSETHTVRDIEWVLQRFTSPEWTPTTVGLRDNDHNGAAVSVLEATVRHDSGSLIQCLPIDPWDHSPGPTVYRRNRIRVRNHITDEQSYVTVEPDEAPLDIETAFFDEFESQTEHPLDTAVEYATFHDQTQVHEVDEQLRSIGSGKGRGYTVETWNEALVAMFAAAQSVTDSQCEQTTLDGF